jgi:predicted lactoylglutathione lyase
MPGMSDCPKNIAAITLFVEDLDRARSFYQKVFELQPAFTDETDTMFRLENTLLCFQDLDGNVWEIATELPGE